MDSQEGSGVKLPGHLPQTFTKRWLPTLKRKLSEPEAATLVLPEGRFWKQHPSFPHRSVGHQLYLVRCLEFRPHASCFSTQPPSAHPQTPHLTWGGRGTGRPTLRSDLALQTANGAALLARAAACQALPELKSSRQVLRREGAEGNPLSA